MTVATRSPTSGARAADPVLADLVEQFLERLQAGEVLDPTDFAAAHPEHAEPLRQLLPALEMMAALSHSAARAGSGIAPTADIAGPGLGLLGDFHILREVGRGGMGVVYEAEQVSLRRRVALKVLPFAAALDPRQLARFKSEARATALLHHTNIVPVHAVGAERGVHYYAMQFIDGRTLADVISEFRHLECKTREGEARDDGHREGEAPSEPAEAIAAQQELRPPDSLGRRSGEGEVPSEPPLRAGRGSPEPSLGRTDGLPAPAAASSSSTRNRAYFRNVARLGLEAAEALDHAHQEGIIHRDIKPANLMVDAKGHLWVTDFGLARLKSDSGLTVSGDLLGTLRYMSPEQALGKRVVIDGRTDIYSLGVTLYELLTLEPAFEGLDRQELLRRIAEQEPRPPRRLDPSIPRELETILLKAMSKEPESRYDLAQELADDLRRFLEHRPIKARRPTLAERAAKWARRHRTLVASALLIVILAAAGLGASVALIARERADGIRHRNLTRHHRYVTDIRQAHELVQNGQGPEVLALLNKWRPGPGEPDVRNFAWHYLLRLCHDERRTLRGHSGAVYHSEFSHDGRTLVSCGQDGTVRFWDVATGRLLRTIPAHSTEVNGTAVSPDGRTLATASDDGTIKLWNVETGAEITMIHAHKGDAIAVRFTTDGRRPISAGRKDGRVKLWDLTTRKELASTRAHESDLESVALAPDGMTLATAGGDGYARLWNLADLAPKKSLRVHYAPVYSLAFSVDSSRLVTADAGGRVLMWDLHSGEAWHEFMIPRHSGPVQGVAFVDGDRTVVTADDHGVSRLSDATTGIKRRDLFGHTGKIWNISVSPDGTTLATASSDGTLKLWDARTRRWERAIPVESSAAHLRFTPDGQTLIVADIVDVKMFASPDGAGASLEVAGFDAKTGAKRFQRLLEPAEHTWIYGLSTDGVIALLLKPDNTVTAWEVATGRRLATTQLSRPLRPVGSRFVEVRQPGGPFELVNSVTGQKRVLSGTETAECPVWAFEAGVAALGFGDELTIWDLTTNRARRTRRGAHAPSRVATFSPDATILADCAGDRRGVIRLWDVNTLELLDNLPGHSANVHDLDFSPDGKVLASVCGEGILKLWDVAARVELLTVRGPFAASPSVRFAPDGRTLAFRAIAADKCWVYLLSTALPEGLTPEEEGP